MKPSPSKTRSFLFALTSTTCLTTLLQTSRLTTTVHALSQQQQKTFLKPPPQKKQTLTFTDSQTGIPVHLIGSMHYNPHSISLTRNILQHYGNTNQLGSIVIEQDVNRWYKIQQIHPNGSPLRTVLDNEFQEACDNADQFDVPLVLGDADINDVLGRAREVFVQTLKDVVNPISGWGSILEDWKRAYVEGIDPSSSSTIVADDDDAGGGIGNNKGDGVEAEQGTTTYLGASDLLDPELLLSSPLSFLRYPLALVIKSPVTGVLVLTWIAFLTAVGSGGEFMGFDIVPFQQQQGGGDLTIMDVALDLTTQVLEFVLLGRVFLMSLLLERNEVLAKNIRAECERMRTEDEEDGVVVEGEDKKKVCVAVLGMAHCNGVKYLLSSSATTAQQPSSDQEDVLI